ncbi:transposase, partial [Breznakia sp. OttesenSCG-928-G09]|nr:transposase [Breznakia sp. OttesenSCG-928-G09]
MGRKSKFTPEQKEEAVLKYKKGIESGSEIADTLGISRKSFTQWILIYES